MSSTLTMFPTALGARQLVAFYDPANTGNLFQPRLNPSTITSKPTSVRKYQKLINGTSRITGQWEFPPQEIALAWNQLDKTDYVALSGYTYLYPLVYVDNNNYGYLGALAMNEVAQVPNVTRNIYSVKASFLVEAPYNGLTGSPLPQLAGPTLTGAGTTGGNIAANTTLHFWATATTPWGESTVGAHTSVATGGSNGVAVNLTWTLPTSNWYRTTKIYWNTTNDPTTATLLTETQPGATGTFTVFGGYVVYDSSNPPLYGRAFKGNWAGGLWMPET